MLALYVWAMILLMAGLLVLGIVPDLATALADTGVPAGLAAAAWLTFRVRDGGGRWRERRPAPSPGSPRGPRSERHDGGAPHLSHGERSR